MRICLVFDCLYPHSVGGGERWYRAVAEGVAARGHDVTYLTLRQWDPASGPGVPSVSVIAVGGDLELYAGGRRSIGAQVRFALGVFRHLARHGARYDVVQTPALHLSLLAVLLARSIRRFGLVVDWFEVWRRAYWLEYLGPVAGRLGWYAQRLSAHNRHAALCFSRLHADRLRALGHEGEITLVEGLRDLDTDQEPVEAAEPVVVFAGRHIPEKRVTAVVPAVALARERLPELRAVIFGDGPDRENVLGQIREGGLGAVVEAPASRRPRMSRRRCAAPSASCFRPSARATASSSWRPPRSGRRPLSSGDRTTRRPSWWTRARTALSRARQIRRPRRRDPARRCGRSVSPALHGRVVPAKPGPPLARHVDREAAGRLPLRERAVDLVPDPADGLERPARGRPPCDLDAVELSRRESTSSIARASASTSPRGTIVPSLPTASGTPPTSVATTGRPQQSASSTESGMFSLWLESTKASEARSRSATSSAPSAPAKSTAVSDAELCAGPPAPWSAARARRARASRPGRRRDRGERSQQQIEALHLNVERDVHEPCGDPLRRPRPDGRHACRRCSGRRGSARGRRSSRSPPAARG